MSFDQYKAHTLTDSEREILHGEARHWKTISNGAHLDEWLELGPGLLLRRAGAMVVANTNEPTGKGYIKYYSEALKDGGYDTKDRRLMTTLTAVLWLHDDPARESILREIRNAMTPGERSRLNSPIAARQRVEAELKKRASIGEKKKERVSSSARIRDLEEQLEAARAELDHEGRADVILISHDAPAADIIKVLRGAPWDKAKREKIARGLLEQSHEAVLTAPLH
jgi:hypothetical protein